MIILDNIVVPFLANETISDKTGHMYKERTALLELWWGKHGHRKDEMVEMALAVSGSSGKVHNTGLPLNVR